MIKASTALKVEVEVEVKVTLRLTVSLGIECPCGTCDQILFPVEMLLSYISKYATFNLPCLDHAAETIRSNVPLVDKLMSSVKKVFGKTPYRKETFKAAAPNENQM
jgi:hypothetical protein